MKIIKQGCVPIKVFIGECKRCGCQVECTPEEVATPLSDMADLVAEASGKRRKVQINCPTKGCGTKIDLKLEEKNPAKLTPTATRRSGNRSLGPLPRPVVPSFPGSRTTT